MKIDVTYEKKDILRLVQKDMEVQGIHVKIGTSLEYKGALQVKFSVETEDDAFTPKSSVSVSEAPVISKAAEVEPGLEDMSSVFNMSQLLSTSHPGKFETKTRPLANNELMQESYEFPRKG
jgi:hypothetical protein